MYNPWSFIVTGRKAASFSHLTQITLGANVVVVVLVDVDVEVDVDVLVEVLVEDDVVVVVGGTGIELIVCELKQIPPVDWTTILETESSTCTIVPVRNEEREMLAGTDDPMFGKMLKVGPMLDPTGTFVICSNTCFTIDLFLY